MDQRPELPRDQMWGNGARAIGVHQDDVVRRHRNLAAQHVPPVSDHGSQPWAAGRHPRRRFRRDDGVELRDDCLLYTSRCV